MAFNWTHSGGNLGNTSSFTISAPTPKRSAPAKTTQVENPYGGFDPNTIDVAPFLEMQSAIQGMALDPQQELRDREAHQLREQTRAGLEARGLNASLYGAGVEADAMRDFGIDWNQAQLGRATQGAQAMQMLGGLRQNVANQGWQHQQDLGRSAFEYEPPTTQQPFTFTHIPQSGGGQQGSILDSMFGGGGGYSSRQQDMAIRQSRADAMNAMALQELANRRKASYLNSRLGDYNSMTRLGQIGSGDRDSFMNQAMNTADRRYAMTAPPPVPQRKPQQYQMADTYNPNDPFGSYLA